MIINISLSAKSRCKKMFLLWIDRFCSSDLKALFKCVDDFFLTVLRLQLLLCMKSLPNECISDKVEMLQFVGTLKLNRRTILGDK